MKEFCFSAESVVPQNRETVWQHITQMKNVNYELMPYALMTYPKNKSGINVSEVPLQTILIRSIILLFGFIPIDLHFLRLDKIVEGEAFFENSTTLMHRYWKHTRTLRNAEAGTVVKDKVCFLPHIAPIGYLLLPVYKTIFRHRHKRLAQALQNL